MPLPVKHRLQHFRKNRIKMNEKHMANALDDIKDIQDMNSVNIRRYQIAYCNFETIE